MYHLQKEWNVDTIVENLENYNDSWWSRSNCDWNRHVCKEKSWHDEYSNFRQYGADVTIIEKFKHYDNLVTNANEADLFLVPYPHQSHCRAPPHGEEWTHCTGVPKKSTENLVCYPLLDFDC